MKRIVLTILLQCFVLTSAYALEEKNVDETFNIIDVKKEDPCEILEKCINKIENNVTLKVETVSVPELSKNDRKIVKKQLFEDLTRARGVAEEMRSKLTGYKLQITNSLKRNNKVDNKIKQYIETIIGSFGAEYGLNTNADAYKMIGLVSEYMHKVTNNKSKNDLNELISVAKKNDFINYISVLKYLSKEDAKKIDEFFDIFREAQQLFSRLAAIVDGGRLKYHTNEVYNVLNNNGIHITFVVEIRSNDDVEIMAKDDRDKLWREVMDIKKDTSTANNIVNMVFELCEARQVVFRVHGKR